MTEERQRYNLTERPRSDFPDASDSDWRWLRWLPMVMTTSSAIGTRWIRMVDPMEFDEGEG